MSKSSLKRIQLMAEARGEFTVLEDGYVYFFPTKGGALSASSLRDLAAILEEKNKEWDEQVHKDLGQEATK